MRRDKNGKQNLLLYCLGFIPVLWLALLVAPYLHEGLIGFIRWFPLIMETPFHITLCEDSMKTVLIFAAVYFLGLGIYLSSDRNYRRRVEYGSAQWGAPKALQRKYRIGKFEGNIILTWNVQMGLDGRIHKRNLNILVIGGSGAGKSKSFAFPNLLNGNTSFVVLDPKGELIRDSARALIEKGYEIRILDLLHMDKSHCYNPFAYLRSDTDVQKMVTILFKATTPKGSQKGEAFWDQTAEMLLKALVFYLYYQAPPEEQTFSMVLEMIRAGEVVEEDPGYDSPLDILFRRLKMQDTEHIAVKYYDEYKKAAGKTLKSIQISLLARLEKFNLQSLANLTQTDELDLDMLGEKRMAIFAVVPDNDDSFNFIVSMLYEQMFQRLYEKADSQKDGRLKEHVHFLMDEFANVALPDNFQKELATMRSREISVSIIIQNMAQLKMLYEKDWENIVGNCDELLYLGGNEQSTHEYISKLLGKETIDTNTYGKTKGRNGSYSTNMQQTGRELLTPDEVRMLDNQYALLFIRGEKPIMDLKFDFKKHPNIGLTPYGEGEPFEYGKDRLSCAALYLTTEVLEDGIQLVDSVNPDEFLLWSEEELIENYEKTKEK